MNKEKKDCSDGAIEEKREMFSLTKKRTLLLLTAFFCCQSVSYAVNLLQVFEQAQISDPVYQQAISQRLATEEGVPISISSILPNISLTANPTITRTGESGTNYQAILPPSTFGPRNATTRSYNLTLLATQTVFNFQQFATIAGSVALSKSAGATLNAALQSLMTRVSAAYFAILRDEENLSYSEAAKAAYAEQLDQVKQQYDVGVKTITEVYTAQARYDSAVSDYIAAETTLSNDRENLRVITGKYYANLSTLSEAFPLISPAPANVETWVEVAQRHNWSVKAAQYNVENAKQVIRQQFAGNLPTVNVQAAAQRQYTDNINDYNSFYLRNGPGTTTNKSIALNMTMPIFEGGGVVASTNQAVYNYQVAQQQEEKILRDTLNVTRQSYLNILSGISKITADKQAIKSNSSSLEGMQASYQVGTETLVNVLNQRYILFQAQTQYATDRYAFVNNVLALKQAAGTLSFTDLRAINEWLVEEQPRESYRQFARTQTHPRHRKTVKLYKDASAETPKPLATALTIQMNSAHHLAKANRKAYAHHLQQKGHGHQRRLAKRGTRHLAHVKRSKVTTT